VAGVVEEGALAVVVELEVEQVAVALVGVAQELEVVPERAVVAVLELALVQLPGQVLAQVREPQSVLDLMHPLALESMLRPVLVRMPRQALAALSVMEPVMDLAMGQGIRGSDLKTALVLDLQSSA
jgi:hypothetical protein